jgi:hypothetical protein
MASLNHPVGLKALKKIAQGKRSAALGLVIITNHRPEGATHYLRNTPLRDGHIIS